MPETNSLAEYLLRGDGPVIIDEEKGCKLAYGIGSEKNGGVWYDALDVFCRACMYRKRFRLESDLDITQEALRLAGDIRQDCVGPGYNRFD